jgi:glycosyltransferase involved in cell wall biosynthesis
MPVFNGERYIKEAIDSILTQTYTDFEFIISDNGSTDATEQICRQYAAADPRIRYIRNEVNRGPSWNFRRVFELSQGEYFKWMAHDDVCDPRFVEQCVTALDANPRAVLCFSKLTMIDELTSTIWPVKAERHLDNPHPHWRFHHLLVSSCFVLEIHGVMRSEALSKTPLIANYATSDRILIARMALFGPLIELPDYLCYYRLHAQQSSSRDRYGLMNWFNPGQNGRVTFPQWKLYWEFLRCANAVPLPTAERLWCYFHLLCFPAWERNWRRLGKDIVIALPQIGGVVARRVKSSLA